MDNNLDKIAKDLYGKIETRFSDIKMGDENAAVLSKKVDIPKARFFEFEYTEDGEPLGTIAITLDKDDGVVVQVSGDLVDDDSDTTHHSAYKFIRSFRKFAKNRLLNFDVQNIGKSNLDKRDYQFQAKPKEQPMMESKMFGTSRISYQDLGEARLIVKHTQPINPELAAGRTMHIECIYIENADGERFKYPYKHLPGARALAEHIKHGGIPYDDIGKHITKLSEELASLRKFKGYVSRQSQISEAMGDVTSRVIDRIDTIKKEIVSLQRPAYYQQFAESFTAKEDQVIPENVMNDWIDRLTVRTFNEDMRSVFPFLYKIVDESELPVCELSSDYFLDEKAPKGWEGTVKAMKKHKEIDNPWALAHSMKNKGYTSHKKESFDPEIAFESFINRIMLEDKDELFSPNKDAQKVAIDKLNKILEKELHGGPDGINAIESLAGLIDDTDFLDSLKDIDPDLDLRPLIQQYVTQADPSVAIQLKFGDGELGGTDLPPVANGAPAPDSEPAPGGAAPAEPDLGGGMPPMGGGMPPMGGELPPEGGEVPPEGEPGAEGAPPAPGSEVPPPAAPGSEVPPPAPVSEELQQLRKLSGLHEDEAEDDTWKYNVDGKEAYTPDQLRYIRDPHSMEVANARARLQDARTSGATPAQIAKYEKEFIALSGGHAADLDQQERMYQASTEKLRETEEVDHKKAKLTAMFIKAKASGATLETMFAEGMTIRDALRESGLTPCETGFGECDTDEEESDDQLDGKTQILNSIEGFWNKEEENFTIGGARVKIKIIKSFKDGDYSNASEDDVKYILTKVNRLDPSDDDREQSDVLRLAGVQDQDSAFANDDDDQTISMLMKELQWHGGRRRHDSIDKHKIRKTMRNNYEQNFKNRAGKFR
jgi:hypothetical protein